MNKINLFKHLLPSLQGDWGLQSSHRCGCSHTKGSKSPFATEVRVGGRPLSSSLLGRISVGLLFALFGTHTASAQEAYAVYDGLWKLTFYYDSQRSSRTGTIYDMNTSGNTPGWYSNNTRMDTVVFDPSFASARPTCIYCWFSGMSNLKTITGIQYLNTSYVTDMTAMFMGCSKLTSLDVSNLNTANVTNMYGMFEGCSRLTNLDLSSFNTNKVTRMEFMFSDCDSLRNLDLSGFNTANVTTMCGMFQRCRKLTNLVLSGINTNNVIKMERMFQGCTALTSLDISSFNTWNVWDMVSMFEECKHLATIYVGEGWSTANVTVSDNMFDQCYDLVGGAGTTYSSIHHYADYAHIDGGTTNPGYFTDIADDQTRESYAMLSSNNTKLTFYFDDQKSSRTGTTINLNSSGNTPGWYSNNTSVTNVVFDPSFASARPTCTYCWFSGMTNLETITGIEYLHTNRVTDMKYMFAYCSKLTTIDLSGFNADNVTNMFGMFEGCSALTTLDARWLSSENVTNMRNMFRNCSALTSLKVSSWSVINVTNMSYMFENCSNLTDLNLNGWITRKVTNMENMFNNCSKLKTISVGDGWSTASVSTSASDGMFLWCSSLVGGNGTTYDVDHIDKEYARVDVDRSPGYLTSYMSDGAEPYAVLSPDETTLTFYYDNQKPYRLGTRYAIEPDIVPGWVTNDRITTVEFHELFANYHGLTSTNGMFAGLMNLEQINHLERLNTENVTDMSSMFKGCSKLTSLNLFYFDTGNVTNMNDMFNGCSSLTSLFLSNFNTSNVRYMIRMFEGCSSLRTLDLNSFDTSKVSNMKEMFFGCNSLETITNMHFNTATVTDMFAMFANCRSLTSLSVSPFNTQNVTSMGSMFENCSLLTTLNLGNFYTSNVTDMGNMFNGCSSLTSIELRTFDTSKVTLMSNMFRNCSSLESLNLSYLNTENVYNMRGMFEGCGCPTLDVTGFNTSKVINTESMFADISATSLNLTNFDMSNIVNFSKMFAGASNLTTIYCEDTWEGSHADSVFVGCTSLTGAISYHSSKISGDYANPETGYFSSKSYAVLSEDGKTLTFYHDDKKQTRPGTKYVLYNNPGWIASGANANITTVVFDGDFYYARPTKTTAWFYKMKNLETITNLKYLNTSQVTDMSEMFNGCSKLTTLDLSRFNTEKVTTMAAMFQGMTAITKLNLGAFNPQNVTNMSNMFYGDTQLTTIYVSSNNWTTESVTNYGGMFYNCTSLVGGAGTTYNSAHYNVDYAHIDGGTSNPGYLTEKKDAYAVQSTDKKTLTFYYDYMMDSREGTVFEMPKTFLTAGWAGYNGRDITTIDFDESFADYDGLTSTMTMFGAMTGLTEINHLDRLNTENVTDMQMMFNGCTALKTLDLSGFNMEKVTTMSYMFYGCSALTTIYVGADWDVSNVTNSTEMFTDCTSLVGGAGTAYNDANPKDKTYARIDGLNNQPGYFSAKVEPYAVYTSGNSTLTFYRDSQRYTRSGVVYSLNEGTGAPGWYANRTSITKVVFNSSFADARPTTTYHWFYGMTNLTTITYISYLNTSEVTNMSGMFYDCQKLTTLNLSRFNTENVTDMSEMFRSCSGLTTLDVSSFHTANVTDMYQMFYHCTGLTSLDLSSFNTANVYDMTSMFDGNSALTSIYVGSGWVTPNDLQESSGMFDDCISLVGGAGTTYDSNNTDFDYAHIDGSTSNPGYLTAVPYAVVSEDCTTLTFYNDGFNHLNDGIFCYLNKTGQMPGWFSYRTGITEVVFDESFANARPTSTYAWFYDMRNLTTFTGMENLNTSEVTNMAMTFASCISLTTLDLSNWNTAKVTDMSYMFNGSGYLTTVYVSDLWSIAKVASSDDMFTFCGSIQGQNGTTYNTSNPEDKTYAHIDGLNDQPGYLSAKVEAYAVHEDDETIEKYTLTFYYDNQRFFHTEGKVYSLNKEYYSPGWKARCHYVDYVVFDPSFADARPTTTYNWFSDMAYLKEIRGLEYLNTSEVTNMKYMFYRCNNSELTSLYLSSFNTEKVTDMTQMFYGCNKLTTIYVGDGWSTTNVTSSSDMFTGCTALVGGNGTTYSSSHVNASYAHIDVDGNPGYFTETPTEPYAVVSTDGKTMTFYYDDIKSQRQGTKYNVPNGENAPDWYWDNAYTNIETVVLDPSFAKARPHYTYCWFKEMGKLSTITGLEYLNTSEVTNMQQMFMGCGLTSLDLSGFDTKNVTDMASMFRFCGSLVTIEVSNKWSTENVTTSDLMFEYCTSIEGSMGTSYDENHIDKEYARIDGGTTRPGYFTYKASILLGDVNGDGKVDVADITALTNYLKGTTGSYNLSAADVDGNGEVTSADVPALVNKILGK